MKKIFLVLLLFSASVFAQSKPVSGEMFSLTYNPALKGILTGSNEITVIYAFDYWGSLPSAPDSAPDLFKNVETPDPGKALSQKMTNAGGKWKASVKIPEDAALISYYFTDGTKNDYNDKKTYVSYIYDKELKPVRKARFCNVDFMVMVGKPLEDQLKELASEVKDYPDNFVAHFAFWNKKLQAAKNYNDLIKAKNQFVKYFTDLEKKYPDNYDLLNNEARTYDQFRSQIARLFTDEFRSVENTYKELVYKIPVDKMSSSVRRSYDAYKRSEEAEKFNEGIVGTIAPDFEFETISGEKHKLSDFKGKTVLLDFWGTWCGPCVGEIPNLKNAYKNYKEKGFEIISISSDNMMNPKNDREYLKKFTGEKGMSWNHVLDNKSIHDLYKIQHWPTLFLVDQNGKIIRNETTLRGPSLEITLKEVLH